MGNGVGFGGRPWAVLASGIGSVIDEDVSAVAVLDNAGGHGMSGAIVLDDVLAVDGSSRSGLLLLVLLLSINEREAREDKEGEGAE